MGFFSKSKDSAENDFRQARLKMVDRQLAGRDVVDPAVLEAMKRVPRHLFVAEDLRREAYDDCPLPIGYGQTISQPYVVGSMTEHLFPDKKKTVLEIGTGSGYQTAILAELFSHVDTVEYIAELSAAARNVLDGLGYTNITFHVGDGLLIPGHELTFDAIIVTAAPATLPESLSGRLNPGGRLIIPVGENIQYLTLIAKKETGDLDCKMLYPVRFVPLQHRD